MLLRQPDDRDWRYHTPFAASSAPESLRVDASTKAPAPVHQPASKLCSEIPLARDRTSQSSLPPPLASTLRDPIPSLHIPHTSHPSLRSHSLSTQLDHEKVERRASKSPWTSRRATPDPEKAAHEHRSMRSVPSSNPISHHSTVVYEDEDEDGSDDSRHHAVWILVYLSVFSPILATGVTLYAIFTTFLILLLSPLCLCKSQQPMRAHLTRFLVPPLHLQLGLVYSQSETVAENPPSSIAMLGLINILGPFVAVGISTAAWVAAAFWMFTKILGNPNANQDKDDESNEGRAAVLEVRRWWEAWLVRGLR